MLADGSIQVFDVHMVDVEWDGQARMVEADVAEGAPLLGMNLLLGYRLQIEVKSGGPLIVAAISQTS